MVGLISVLHIQRTVSVGNTEESVGLRATKGRVELEWPVEMVSWLACLLSIV